MGFCSFEKMRVVFLENLIFFNFENGVILTKESLKIRVNIFENDSLFYFVNFCFSTVGESNSCAQVLHGGS